MATIEAQAPRQPSLRTIGRRYLYVMAGGVMLLMMIWGFRAYYLRGMGAGDVAILPQMVRLDAVHGSAVSAWIGLFFVQALLVASNRRNWHKLLGWCSLAVAITACSSGLIVAVLSVKSAPGFVFFGMPYREFLLVMLTEMVTFACFVTLAVVNRKRPPRHRAMMLMASLSVLAGSTVRMPGLAPYFGDSGWNGIFGPVTVLGVVLLVLRSLIDRKLDRWLTGGLLAMTAAYILAVYVAATELWSSIASSVFGV